ncbi:cation:proton antiporter [Leifsonia sp. McL0607]|uniref:cation:proton antiporter n=1 Tax=Leifsonia sp. McL0607 TaxID=3415672 RepID=UPI003CF7718E
MSFALLALVVAIGLLGPFAAARASWRVPAVVGELAGGLLIGTSGLQLVDPTNDDFQLLAEIGFGLTMVVVGSQIPLRDPDVRAAFVRGALGAGAVGAASAVLAAILAAVSHSGHGLLYGVLLASSSAALVLPMLQSVGVGKRSAAQLVAQIAVADIVCVVLLPLVVEPGRALSAGAGVLVIAVIAAALALILVRFGNNERRRALHAYSERRRFAVELRLSLLVLFSFAAIAQFAHLSILIAGFALGLLLSAVGEPHRLARQLFGMTEGFFGPLFFVWLGASLDLRALVDHPAMILLGIALGVGAVLAHLASRAAGLPWTQAVASAGQLGVPVAAVTLGLQTHALAPGEGSAILLGALVCVATSAVSVAAVARRAGGGVRATPGS